MTAVFLQTRRYAHLIGMDHDKSNKRPVLLTISALMLTALGAWHYLCHIHLESALRERGNEYLSDTLPGWTVTVDVQPLTNLVSIYVEQPAQSKDGLIRAVEDVFLEYVRREIEGELERELRTVARADVDLYAMLVPYHVSITLREDTVVKEVQNELKRLGYDVGSADGINGPRTQRAIIDVQTQLGRTPDGKATKELLKILRSSQTASSE